MNKRAYSNIVLAAALAAATTACNSSEGPAPQVAPAPPEPAQEAQPAPNAALEQATQDNMQAPFVLTLVTPTKVPDKAGTYTIEAQIKAPRELDAPTTIEIVIPKVAKLNKGQDREVLVNLPAGLTSRSFEVELIEPLSEAEPIKIRVDMRDPQGTFGAHAEKVYPEKKKVKKPGNSRVPKPPQGRPGG